MFEKFINKILTFKKDNCNELVPVTEYSGIISLCKLYTVLATPENGVRRGTSPGQRRGWGWGRNDSQLTHTPSAWAQLETET